jgi:hypothetical protein
MGGQACVLYGAAEFSRDTDLVVLADSENLDRLRLAMEELQAEVIAVPPFAANYLHRGHAIHFRCQRPDVAGMRVDVMAKMRGVGSFDQLWNQRTTVEEPSGVTIEVLSLPDLVRVKKTQRDKDWPMIRRLVEVDYHGHRETSTTRQVHFWLRECRTSAILAQLVKEFMEKEPSAAEELATVALERPLLKLAMAGDETALSAALTAEEAEEREADRRYWAPLRAELERLRHERHGKE